MGDDQNGKPEPPGVSMAGVTVTLMPEDRLWSRDMFDVQRIWYLEWVLDQHSQGRAPRASHFTQTGDDRTEAIGIAQHLATHGLVNIDAGQRLGGSDPSVLPTDLGRERVRLIHSRRGDRRMRASAARDAVLDWLYETQDGPTPAALTYVRGRPWSYVEGDPFTDEELEAAGKYLEERGLVTGVPVADSEAPLHPRITGDGRDCVEQYDGSVVAWSNRNREGRTQFVTHFHGEASGQFAFAGRDVHQTQHQGVDAETLQRLLDDVRRDAESIDSAERGLFLAYVDALQAEASAEQPDPSMIQGSSTRLKQIAARVGSPALTTSVAVLVTNVLRAFGLG